MEPTEPAVQGYDVVRLLGRGGAGDVWLVRHQRSGSLRAAKVLRAGAGSIRAAAHPLRRELRRQAVRSHPHLLTCLASTTDDRTGAAVLLSEYAAGGSLARLVAARGRLTAGETVTTMGPIAQAAAFLHAQGRAHLDIAPGNILFTSEGRPLLADFGEARQVGDKAGETRGTDGFFDPFSSGAIAAVRPAADVYGLGAVAWFCLVGSAPGPRRARPPLGLLAPGIPAELATAVEAALAEDPRERPTAAEFARAVLRSRAADPVDLAPAVDADVLPELVTRLQEGSRRRRALSRRPGFAVPRRPRPRFIATVFAASAAAATAAVALAGTGVFGLGDHSSKSAPTVTATATRWSALPEPLRRGAESDDPVQAVQSLAEIRALAVSGADRELLARINAPGSEADAADRKLAADLESSGQRLEGFTARVLSAELAGTDSGDAGTSRADAAEAGGSTAVVRVRVVTSAFSVRGRDGTELKRPAEAKDQWLRIVLERRDPGWQVSRVLPAALPMIGG
ncbi:serine/threonine-protein kinase [Sinomonas humi]|uniref:non-specific serine/threonine protein kinase n=1 Tax=Sinomonas humi TaxID=1338436 RepID=A0A0B2AHR0_9MICC|nr:serine/threonine-protein kinase [Sinomonas humi]KHL03102.1 hypothetical protein LK10_09970 [Sinomonas humi]